MQCYIYLDSIDSITSVQMTMQFQTHFSLAMSSTLP